jgi:DNA-binding transcriptional MerR regulator/methylmalonyl-CoA mutase cobalamin-binding subunit
MTTMASAEERLPIRTVSSLTGVLPVTLRAWERRYGLIRPHRTPSGHRFYTRAHVDLIHRVLALTAKGMPISEVRRSLDALAADSPGGADAGPWSRYLERMARAISQYDEATLDEVYDDALAVHSIERVTRKLLMPLLAELGRRWERAEGGVAEEHFFSVYLRNKLGARLHHRRPPAGPRLLLACAPAEQHELGLLLFALAAHDAGMRCVTLGASMPLGELAAAALRAGCRAIVLSSSVEPAPGTLGDDLPELVAQARVPVFVGGATSIRQRDAVVAAGAHPLGDDIETGARRLLEHLESKGSPP